MKKIFFLFAMIIPIISNAQFIARDPHADCKYKVGDVVLIPFNQMISLWLIDSPDRVSDSIAIRNQLIREFDTVEVKAVIIERFFIKDYGIGYYFIAVYDKYGQQRPTPIHRTGTMKGRFVAISENYIRKRPLTI